MESTGIDWLPEGLIDFLWDCLNSNGIHFGHHWHWIGINFQRGHKNALDAMGIVRNPLELIEFGCHSLWPPLELTWHPFPMGSTGIDSMPWELIEFNWNWLTSNGIIFGPHRNWIEIIIRWNTQALIGMPWKCLTSFGVDWIFLASPLGPLGIDVQSLSNGIHRNWLEAMGMDRNPSGLNEFRRNPLWPPPWVIYLESLSNGFHRHCLAAIRIDRLPLGLLEFQWNSIRTPLELNWNQCP